MIKVLNLDKRLTIKQKDLMSDKRTLITKLKKAGFDIDKPIKMIEEPRKGTATYIQKGEASDEEKSNG